MFPTGFEPVANGLKDRCSTDEEIISVSTKSVSTDPIWAFLFVAVLHQEMPVLFINFIQNNIWLFLTINKQSSFLPKKSLCNVI